MAAKAVLNVAVNNTQIKAAAQQVQNIQQFVKTLPPLLQKTNQWGRYNTQTYRLWAQHVQQVQQATAGVTTNVQATATASTKLAQTWKQMAAHAKQVHKSTKEFMHLSKSLWKWSAAGTIASGLLGVGSLWGISRLAGGVADERRTAMGLGVPTGAMKGFNLAMGRFLGDPMSMLGAMQEAKADRRHPANIAMAALGMSGFKGNPVEMANEFIKRLRAKFPAGSRTEGWGSFAESAHLTSVMDLKSIQAMIDAKPEEVEAQMGKQGKYAKDFKLADEIARGWADLAEQLKAASDGIEHTLVKGLAPLADPINKLSDAFSKLVEEVLDMAKKEGWIDALKNEINSFTDDLKKPETKEGILEFAKGLSGLAKTMSALVRRFAPEPGGHRVGPFPDNSILPPTPSILGAPSIEFKTPDWVKMLFGLLPSAAPLNDPSGGWIVGQHTPSVRVANNTSNRLLVIETGAGSSYNVAAQQVSIG